AFLDACRNNNPQPRIVYAGTRSQYGRVQYLPVDEKHPLLPTDINSVHKQAAETYHLLYNRIYGIPICSLRLTNTYGPRLQIENDAHGFLGWFIRRALEGGCIQVYGDGQQKRDLNYVEDVVDAFLLAGIAPQAVGEVFNLGSGQAVKVLEFAQKVIEVSGSGSYQLVPYPGIDKAMEIGDYQADYTKIKSLLGWQPRYSLEDGLKTTVEYVAVRLGGSRDS
ncbi:MAG TPA: NAD-dependent epimerase/dehydratase family protein, partial [Dehalococcoidia bacterium]|nr:NAD-dependent epimerase/dehydratase family protein [Dehalococcoidia bacterium]